MRSSRFFPLFFAALVCLLCLAQPSLTGTALAEEAKEEAQEQNAPLPDAKEQAEAAAKARAESEAQAAARA